MPSLWNTRMMRELDEPKTQDEAIAWLAQWEAQNVKRVVRTTDQIVEDLFDRHATK